jgi:hypothetical protein
MEQSPSEANRFAASQEIPHILWNSKVHYSIHNSPSPRSILSQLNAVHTPTYHFLKIHLNIILPDKPGSPQWSISLRFPHQTPVHASPSPSALHVPPISFFSILSPAQYRVRSTDHEVPRRDGQSTRGGTPAWGLGEGLTTPVKMYLCYQILTAGSNGKALAAVPSLPSLGLTGGFVRDPGQKGELLPSCQKQTDF